MLLTAQPENPEKITARKDPTSGFKLTSFGNADYVATIPDKNNEKNGKFRRKTRHSKPYGKC